eukprot:6044453-Pleurochrysis_carterae.AAC.1
MIVAWDMGYDGRWTARMFDVPSLLVTQPRTLRPRRARGHNAVLLFVAAPALLRTCYGWRTQVQSVCLQHIRPFSAVLQWPAAAAATRRVTARAPTAATGLTTPLSLPLRFELAPLHSMRCRAKCGANNEGEYNISIGNQCGFPAMAELR